MIIVFLILATIIILGTVASQTDVFVDPDIDFSADDFYDQYDGR